MTAVDTATARRLEQDTAAGDRTDVYPACPWCHHDITETHNLDGYLQGWAYTRRTYRCDICQATIRVDGDPEPR